MKLSAIILQITGSDLDLSRPILQYNPNYTLGDIKSVLISKQFLNILNFLRMLINSSVIL